MVYNAIVYGMVLEEEKGNPTAGNHYSWRSVHFSWQLTSMIEGSARVLVSPSLSASPSAILRRIRLMILPASTVWDERGVQCFTRAKKDEPRCELCMVLAIHELSHSGQAYPV